jgi:hypothetical protein
MTKSCRRWMGSIALALLLHSVICPTAQAENPCNNPCKGSTGAIPSTGPNCNLWNGNTVHPQCMAAYQKKGAPGSVPKNGSFQPSPPGKTFKKPNTKSGGGNPEL